MVSQEISLLKPETKKAIKPNFQQAVLSETKRKKANIVHNNKKGNKMHNFLRFERKSSLRSENHPLFAKL